MNDDDDDQPTYTMDELFETARAILAWSDMKRSAAERKPTEALALRLEAAESEAEGLVVLRELVAFRREAACPCDKPADSRVFSGPPTPNPGRPAEHPDAQAAARLQEIVDGSNLRQSARYSPSPGSPRSPSRKRTPPEARQPSQAEAPTLTGAAPVRGLIYGRAANLDSFVARPALQRA